MTAFKRLLIIVPVALAFLASINSSITSFVAEAEFESGAKKNALAELVRFKALLDDRAREFGEDVSALASGIGRSPFPAVDERVANAMELDLALVFDGGSKVLFAGLYGDDVSCAGRERVIGTLAPHVKKLCEMVSAGFGGARGLVALEGMPYFVAAASVGGAARPGSHGPFLIAAKALCDFDLISMSNVLSVPLSITLTGDRFAQRDVREALPVLAFKGAFARDISNGFVTAYAGVPDVSGVQSFVMKVEKPFEWWRKENGGGWYGAILLLFSGALLGALPTLMALRGLNARLRKMKYGLARVENDPECERCVEVEGFDELALLGREVNVLLARSDASEKSHQAALERFRKLFDCNPALMAVSTMDDTRFIDVNMSFVEKLKYRRDEIIGRSASELGLFVEDDAHVCAAAELAGTGRLFNRELKVRTKDGDILTGLFSGEVIENSVERVFLTVMTDITVQKKAEEEAREAVISKSETLVGMSHEIRTPLNSVIGFTDLLLAAGLSQSQTKYALNARASARHLLEIVNDVLDLSKMEAGRFELDEVMTDVVDLVERSVDMLKVSASGKKLELIVDIPISVPRSVRLDPVRVRQILVNLVGNAIKFTDKGEVEISLRFEASHTPGIGKFNFSVRDTGIGISREDQAKLFKAFAQADVSTTRKFGGTGLGLVISNHIASKMGTSIQMESEPGKGSVFGFSVNASYDPASFEETGGLHEPGRILIVEDNERCAVIIGRMLGERGIEYEYASNGLQALGKIGAGRFDTVLVDNDLSCMSRMETSERIREKFMAVAESCRVILMQGFGSDTGVSPECYDLDPFARLTKPVKRGELFETLFSIPPVGADAMEIYEPEAERVVRIESVPCDAERKKILIVDDMKPNLEVAKAFIAKMMPKAVLLEAFDGAEALSVFERERPDLVLLDVQMPVMDGCEAAARMRKAFDGGHEIPIVAMTAGVLSGEREKCLAAGMDDYISKPIDSEALRDTLARYLKCVAFATEEFRGPVTRCSGKTTGVLDFDSFRRYTGGQKELMDLFVTSFNEQRSSCVDDIIEALASGDAARLVFASHKLKGMASILGASRLVAVLAELEDGGRGEDLGGLRPTFGRLVSELEMLDFELRKLEI